jgi:tetratricopeptide (TPR) repeat protein
VPYGEERRAEIQTILRGYTEALNFVKPTETDVENLAVLYRDIGELGAALKTIDTALERGYESVGMHEIKGGISYALASDEIARVQGAGMPESEAGGHRDAAAAYLQDALRAYSRAAEMDPMNVSHWLNLGAVMRALGDYEAARAYWQRVLAIDPDNENARRGIATLGD